jgi:predicted signal transduction protein with EAL and GGDEF domain
MMAATSGPPPPPVALRRPRAALIELTVELSAFAIAHRRRAERAPIASSTTNSPACRTARSSRIASARPPKSRAAGNATGRPRRRRRRPARHQRNQRPPGRRRRPPPARERLQKNLRRCDTIARTGGDKFALVAQVANGVGDLGILARKVLSIVSTPVRVGDREVSLAANVGVSLFPTDGETAAQLIDTAEAAAHRSKREGHNTFQFFRPTADGGEKNLVDLELRGHLRKAVEAAIRRQRTGQSSNEDAGLLELHYQPQVDAEGRIVGVEALARWTHPTFGRIPPDRFIALAEDCGLIVSFGEWALREAATQVRAWRQRFGPRAPRVAVNVSALQFADTDFTDGVERLLAEAPWSPGWLELEITETVLMADAEEAARKVARLRAMGLSVALDDFGTGYSSLAYLHRLTLDVLKIDRSFVMGLPVAERRPPGMPLPPARRPPRAGRRSSARSSRWARAWG